MKIDGTPYRSIWFEAGSAQVMVIDQRRLPHDLRIVPLRDRNEFAAAIRAIAARKGGGTVNLLTHCNAGWLATVDWGTATSPIYHAHQAGIPVHVFVDETRPRNQGAQLTAWELGSHGVSHDLIVDNAGGHLMQHGEMDMVIVGTDRTTAQGDVCNKIGPNGTSARNPAFDVTPAALVTGLVTERGVCPASAAGMAAMFPDLAP